MKGFNIKYIKKVNFKKIVINFYSCGFISLLISFPIFFSGCIPNNKKVISDACVNIKNICIKHKVNILFVTNKGNITIELAGDISPVTVGNFVDLVERGFYDNTSFHRVINDPIPFILQGGSNLSRISKVSEIEYGKGNFVDPETGKVRYIPLEIKLRSEDLPRYNKKIKSNSNLLGIELPHKRGSIAMARSEALDSASSQFYIALDSLPELDGRYSVFGRVVIGMNIIDSIQQNDFIIRAKRLK